MEEEIPGVDSGQSFSLITDAVPCNGKSVSTSASGRRRRKRPKKSWVYGHFAEEVESDGRVICCVNGCGRSYAGGTSTTTLATHLKTIHKLVEDGSIPGDIGQKTFSKNGSRLISHNILDKAKQEHILSALVRWIVDNKIPFSVVENASFLRLLKQLNPLFSAPSRRTIGRGIEDRVQRREGSVFSGSGDNYWSSRTDL
jgi:hypothetical protein